MKNGVGLGTVAGGPESRREGAVGSSETLCALMWIPASPSPSPPGAEPSVQAVMLLWGREDRWEVVAALRRERRELV